ncbi:hypothetical protein MHH70_01720 [Metasolibacillus sp. FSL H7-0170]|uniref:hypothetical protein n=1 Tax=Metasolibacillus sp. FSL H7-0170 TaxID=2921431 RepID=UPI003157FB22
MAKIKNSTNELNSRRIGKLWTALNKYGIYTEDELKKAVEEMQPLNISCMVAPINNNNKKAN